MSVEHIPFDLHALVSVVMKPLSVRAEEKQLELVCEVGRDVPRNLIGDPGRIRQILINLLNNAIKFTERGEVELKVSMQDRQDTLVNLCFVVRDTGIGIPPDKQRLIFEAFTQEDNSTTRRFGGTGLGLTISTRLSALMGGKIRVESETGQGSRFYLQIPLEVDVNQRPPVVPHNLCGLKVLVVDDNTVNRQVVCRMLDQWQMRFVEAASGRAALDILQRDTAFDIMLLDFQMPEMDGFDLVSRMRLDKRLDQLKIILLSSASSPGQGAQCRELGIRAYLTKPVAQHELVSAMQTLLGEGRYSPGRSGQTPLITHHSLSEQHKSLRVLVAEDNLVNQKLIATLLGKWGHDFTLAKDGEEAVTLSATHDYDLILMDIHMPVMGGLEATELIRARETSRPGARRLPIHALTAAALPEEREEALKRGVDGYLTKPINKKELMELLDSLAGADMASTMEPQRTELSQASPGFDYLAATAQVDQEVVALIREDFLRLADQEWAALESAFVHADWSLLARLAHTQKGVVANFGARPLQDMLADLEQQSLVNAPSDPARMNALKLEWQVFCTALQKHGGTERTSRE